MWENLQVEWSWIWSRCRSRFRRAIALSLAFKALNVALLAPASAFILHACLTRFGRASVGNFELASFFASPTGLAAILGVGTVLLASTYLEISGMLRLLAKDLPWWRSFAGSAQLFHRLVELGLRQLAMYLALALPFLAAIAVVYWTNWSGKDLNGIIILKPPAFWWGVVLAGILAAIYCMVALYLFLRRIYAVPLLTFEGALSVSAALKISMQRSMGTMRRSAAALVVWMAAQVVIDVATLGLLHLILRMVLTASASTPTLAMFVTALVLLIDALATISLGVFANLTFAGVVLSLYRKVAADPAFAERAAAPLQPAAPSQLSGVLWIALLAVTSTSLFASALSMQSLHLNDSLEITAHRAGATSAPENTVAALRQAILDHADWAEIDVQLTADESLVVMHDIDLARVGGGNRRVDQATLAEIRELDVGTPFGPAFVGERIPTFQEMLAAASGQIRLNVELKPHSKSDGENLTRRVIEAIREAKMVDRCRLCSQSYESLQLAKELEPRLEVGYIVATTVGDPTQLNVNFLMLKAKLATAETVDRAKLRGVSIHAWTVNDPAQVGPLLDAGVANLITDDPARMRNQLDEIKTLAPAQRLLLRARHLLIR